MQEWSEAFTLADKYPEYREQVKANLCLHDPQKNLISLQILFRKRHVATLCLLMHFA